MQPVAVAIGFAHHAKPPLFTCTVVLTVALAIGANITVFSVVNAVLLRPLPFSDPGRVVQVAEKNDKLHLPSFGSSVLNFLSWRDAVVNDATIFTLVKTQRTKFSGDDCCAGIKPNLLS